MIFIALQGASPSRTPDRSPRRRLSATGMLRRVSSAAAAATGGGASAAGGGCHSRQPSIASVDDSASEGFVGSAAGGPAGGSQQRTPRAGSAAGSPTAAEAAGITGGATAVAITGGEGLAVCFTLTYNCCTVV